MVRMDLEGEGPSQGKEPTMLTETKPSQSIVNWQGNHGPLPGKLDRYAGHCQHDKEKCALTLVALGPDDVRFILNHCEGCGSRAWFNTHGRTTNWLNVTG